MYDRLSTGLPQEKELILRSGQRRNEEKSWTIGVELCGEGVSIESVEAQGIQAGSADVELSCWWAWEKKTKKLVNLPGSAIVGDIGVSVRVLGSRDRSSIEGREVVEQKFEPT